MTTPIESQEFATRYRIDRRLGEGEIGIVYEAFDQLLDKTVALKVLSHTVTERLSIRLQTEARATGMLNHPNIVMVLDFGITEQQQPYMVMEYLVGTSLADLLKRRDFNPSTKCVIYSRPTSTKIPVVPLKLLHLTTRDFATSYQGDGANCGRRLLPHCAFFVHVVNQIPDRPTSNSVKEQKLIHGQDLESASREQERERAEDTIVLDKTKHVKAQRNQKYPGC